MAINEPLKRAIEDIKIKFNLKQSEIATKLNVKSTYLSDMINGRVVLSDNVINKLYELFQIPLNEYSYNMTSLTENERKEDYGLVAEVNRLEGMVKLLKEQLKECQKKNIELEIQLDKDSKSKAS